MVMIGIIGVFAGYTVTSYGWVLIRGWNITFKQWVSPLNPYIWTGSDPGTIPDGQIFAGQSNANTLANASLLSAPGSPSSPSAPGSAPSFNAGGGPSSSGLNNIISPGVTANPDVGALFPVVTPGNGAILGALGGAFETGGTPLPGINAYKGR